MTAFGCTEKSVYPMGRLTVEKLRHRLKEETKMSSYEPKQVIVVRKDLNMRKGKIAAQVAHASMRFLVENNTAERGDVLHVELSPDEAQWLLNGRFTKVVVSVDSEEELEQLILKATVRDIEVHKIIDCGKTEFNGVATLTCAAFGPTDPSIIDPITGNLRLM